MIFNSLFFCHFDRNLQVLYNQLILHCQVLLSTWGCPSAGAGLLRFYFSSVWVSCFNSHYLWEQATVFQIQMEQILLYLYLETLLQFYFSGSFVTKLRSKCNLMFFRARLEWLHKRRCSDYWRTLQTNQGASGWQYAGLLLSWGVLPIPVPDKNLPAEWLLEIIPSFQKSSPSEMQT